MSSYLDHHTTPPTSIAIHKITEALKSGDHFGKEGSFTLAKKYVLPHVEVKNVRMMMLMTNVLYTVAAYLSSGGFFGKVRAGFYLHQAKRLATEAFLQEGKGHDLTTAITNIDVRLGLKHTSVIGYGDVHLLMSCFLRFHLSGISRLTRGYEMQVIRECNKTIQRCDSEALRMLSLSSMYELPEVSHKEKDEIEKKLYNYLSRHHDRLMMQDVKRASDADKAIAQVVCRISRSLGYTTASSELAEHFMLGDQAKKVRA